MSSASFLVAYINMPEEIELLENCHIICPKFSLTFLTWQFLRKKFLDFLWLSDLPKFWWLPPWLSKLHEPCTSMAFLLLIFHNLLKDKIFRKAFLWFKNLWNAVLIYVKSLNIMLIKENSCKISTFIFFFILCNLESWILHILNSL